ncbi:hypothetical protein Bca4012_093900 [Brassica carinata]|uniref:Uncharacterized protein n=1 Tax=Brassica carinata TaxID=52824 RepID=A0A8X7PSH6_BRACI|nr:hypothetical protein Bca52824_076114 [Brassica carinata]
MNVDDEGRLAPPTRAKRIGKRALKNKSVTVSFDEKDLRKKKRRKEAQKQQEESMRRKRIEARKKRKLEEMMIAGHGEENEEGEANEDAKDEETKADASTSGTTMYDTGELKVTVTTSEISCEEEDEPVRREKTQSTESDVSTVKASTSQPLPLRKSKPSKQNRRHKSSTKTMKKRDKKKQARGIKSSR